MRRLTLAVTVVSLVVFGLAPTSGAQGAGDSRSGDEGEAGAPSDPWALLDAVPAARSTAVSYIQPDEYQALALDQDALVAELESVPLESSSKARAASEGAVVALPSPTGGLVDFHVVESPVMDPELAAEFPDIRTYAGQGIDDPAATVRFDVSDQGFHAQVLSPHGAWYIDPYYHLSTSAYISYFKRDLTSNPHGDLVERVIGSVGEPEGADSVPKANRSGTQLRTHRAAFAATGEYTQFHGGTVPQAQAAIATAINRINGIYEVEVAIRLVLVANNNLLVETNPAADPYANAAGDEGIAQGIIDTRIGDPNYDIGHVLTTASGGQACLACVGVSNQKAQGTTGIPMPVNDPFVVDFVAHEVGHQYGGEHTFNATRGSCGGNRNAATAYEPGSGTTIQGYAGICDLDNVQDAPLGNGADGSSDPYFHSISFDQIVAHTTGGSPGDLGATATGNDVPSANAGPDGTIPARTPFLLEGAGTDANGVLTYTWEQRDLGNPAALDQPEITAGPLFRSLVGTVSPVRYLPRLPSIAAGNTNVPGPCPALAVPINVSAAACWSEFIPTMSRPMNFRLTVRDNRAGGGGVNTDDMVVTVNDTGQPFAVTSQGAAVTYPAGSTQTVTWDVAGTTAAPISAPNVDIRLSTDGGRTFPTTLATTTNDGNHNVTLPTVDTSAARFMVVESGTGPGVRFFNINAANFTIGTGGCPANDAFSCATLTGGPPSTAPGSNAGFTVEAGEPSPSCGDPSTNTAWWRWTASSAGSVTIDTNGSNFDTVLAVYTGAAVNALTQVACDDDSGSGSLSSATLAATAGTTYWIQVDGKAGATGSINVNVGAVAAAGVPGAPTGVTGVAGDRSVTVSWTAPANTGADPNLTYTVTGTPAGTCTATAPTTTCQVTGLTNGVPHTFTVSAANSSGAGPASAPSATVIPRLDCSGPIANPFVDVAPSSFAANDIGCLSGLGVTGGTTPTTYSPADPVTREQMAAFLARLYRTITAAPCGGDPVQFTDVSATSFARNDIGCILSLNVTGGTTPTTYSPADPVTREQMAAFLARLYRTITAAPCGGDPVQFTDVSATSFARNDIGCILSLNVTGGTTPTTYSPADPVTREQMAAFLARLYRVTT